MAGVAPSVEVPRAGEGAALETPAVRQYRDAKEAHPDCLVLFRLGDFFEIFAEDAQLASSLLDLTLTSRDFGRGGRVPMCGVPHRAAETYIRRLLDAGKSVAVCDQVEAPQPGRLVMRKVVRVLTPGTVIEEGLLDAGRSVRCAALVGDSQGWGLAGVDVSTGDCWLEVLFGQVSDTVLAERLSAWSAGELLLSASELPGQRLVGPVPVVRVPEGWADLDQGIWLLGGEPGAGGRPLSGAEEAAARALARIAAYCKQNQVQLDPRLLQVRWIGAETMLLDRAAVRNLELFASQTGDKPGVLALIDRCRTAPGRRQLREWLMSPLADWEQLTQRQRAVAQFAADGELRSDSGTALAGCRDVSRCLARSLQQMAGPKELLLLGRTLQRLPLLAQRLSLAAASRVTELGELLELAPSSLAHTLVSALADEAPASERDGPFIRDGYDAKLDEIRGGSASARSYIAELEERERVRTGIKGLKVGYNRVFGYYIEIRRSSQDRLPAEYQRRQTLVGAERYITADLKEQESIVLGAREQAQAREAECLRELRTQVAAEAESLSLVGRALGELDAIVGLAEAGVEHGWVMPVIDQSLALELIGGRHPLVEASLGAGRFVPNDAVMDGTAERIALITGPNMAGKSTYLRQVALIVVLGQMGSMVPCSRARWGLVDRVHTRIGAYDDLAAGRSTFMVEMAEMATILRTASERSLLILDEIGRGTSTYDGLSIARAILEHLHNEPGAPRRTLFATHFHELTGLPRSLPAAHNLRVEVIEEGSGPGARITFLHRIVPGGADRSYGINVAQLAGLPDPILRRAAQIMEELEESSPVLSPEGSARQLPLPLPETHPVVRELSRLEVEAMTPLEALQWIASWKQQTGEPG